MKGGGTQETFTALAFGNSPQSQEKLQLVCGKLIRACTCASQSRPLCYQRSKTHCIVRVCVCERQTHRETRTRFCARIKTTDSIRHKHNWTSHEELAHEKFQKPSRTIVIQPRRQKNSNWFQGGGVKQRTRDCQRERERERSSWCFVTRTMSMLAPYVSHRQKLLSPP